MPSKVSLIKNTPEHTVVKFDAYYPYFRGDLRETFLHVVKVDNDHYKIILTPENNRHDREATYFVGIWKNVNSTNATAQDLQDCDKLVQVLKKLYPSNLHNAVLTSELCNALHLEIQKALTSSSIDLESLTPHTKRYKTQTKIRQEFNSYKNEYYSHASIKEVPVKKIESHGITKLQYGKSFVEIIALPTGKLAIIGYTFGHDIHPNADAVSAYNNFFSGVLIVDRKNINTLADRLTNEWITHQIACEYNDHVDPTKKYADAKKYQANLAHPIKQMVKICKEKLSALSIDDSVLLKQVDEKKYDDTPLVDQKHTSSLFQHKQQENSFGKNALVSIQFKIPSNTKKTAIMKGLKLAIERAENPCELLVALYQTQQILEEKSSGIMHYLFSSKGSAYNYVTNKLIPCAINNIKNISMVDLDLAKNIASWLTKNNISKKDVTLSYEFSTYPFDNKYYKSDDLKKAGSCYPAQLVLRFNNKEAYQKYITFCEEKYRKTRVKGYKLDDWQKREPLTVKQPGGVTATACGHQNMQTIESTHDLINSSLPQNTSDQLNDSNQINTSFNI
jgi:hypothetical protein